MKLFKKIFSIGIYFYIELQRFIDHSWRRFTGLPALRRSMITPQLYLGGQYTHRGYKRLNKMRFTGIINMRLKKDIPDEFSRSIKILHLPTPDQRAPSIENLKKGIAFISSELQKNGKVYVHCRAGEGRGPTMVIAYLISTGMLLEDAYTLVKKIRPFIRVTPPQKGILKQLDAEFNPQVITS